MWTEADLYLSISKTNRHIYICLYNALTGHIVLSLSSNDLFLRRHLKDTNLNLYYLLGRILKWKCAHYGIQKVFYKDIGNFSKNMRFFFEGFYN
uniref:Ribosomal protein L18 n=1 Tax=Jakoba bahamiensis TaxID=221721 RepID=M4QL33_9EUKA|nr:ribosomal protein L18 [Jakoba bahamiensis]AGH24163.1 ribosomal protein L18 [Jakoba bahamiensis]